MAISDSAALSRCFAPVVDKNTKVLILGSLPGVASLRAQQYYAHPQNKFWELVGAVIGIDLRSLSYDDRLGAVLTHGVGLWDVISEAERKGSLDAAIRNESHNQLVEMLETLPNLRAIAFNGGISARIGRKQLKTQVDRLELIDLPSSSPAYTLPIEQKLLTWKTLAAFL